MRLTDLKTGDRVIVDGGFDCMTQGIHPLQYDSREDAFFLHCVRGKHYLSGQEDNDGELVGISPCKG